MIDSGEAALVIVSGEVRRMDLIIDELGEVVVSNVHIGAGAAASKRGAGIKDKLGALGVGRVNLGKLGYPIGAMMWAFDEPSVHVDVELDVEVVTDVDRPVLMLSIGNGANVGGGTSVRHPTPTRGRSGRMMISPPRRHGCSARPPPAPRRAPSARRRAVPPRPQVTISGDTGSAPTARSVAPSGGVGTSPRRTPSSSRLRSEPAAASRPARLERSAPGRSSPGSAGARLAPYGARDLLVLGLVWFCRSTNVRSPGRTAQTPGPISPSRASKSRVRAATSAPWRPGAAAVAYPSVPGSHNPLIRTGASAGHRSGVPPPSADTHGARRAFVQSTQRRPPRP